MKWTAKFVVLWLLASSALAANNCTRVDSVAAQNIGGFMKVIPLAVVNVGQAGCSGTPCLPAATVYSDNACSVVIGTVNADANGNFHFYAKANQSVHYQVSGGNAPVFDMPDQNITWPSDGSATAIFSGGLTATSVNGIQYVGQQAGASVTNKADAAQTALGGAGDVMFESSLGAGDFTSQASTTTDIDFRQTQGSGLAGMNVSNSAANEYRASSEYELGVTRRSDSPSTFGSVVGMLGRVFINQTSGTSLTADGVFGGCSLNGTSVTTANVGGSCSGIEGSSNLTSTGGFLGFLRGGTFSANLLSGASTNIREAVSVYGQAPTATGYMGIVTAGFSGKFELPVNAANIKYGIYNQGSFLNCNGCHLDFEMAPFTVSSAVITGCPSACLATITTSAPHGYTTADKVEVTVTSDAFGCDGFYSITVTGGSTFTYTPIGTANGTCGSAGSTAKIAPNVLAVDSSNRIIIKELAQGATNGDILFQSPAANLGGWATNDFFVGPNIASFTAKISSAGLGTFNGGVSLNGSQTLNAVTGNGAKIATGTGSYTSGNGVKIDANGNLVDAGSPTVSFTCVQTAPVTVSNNTASDQNLMTCTVPAGTLNSSGKTLMIQTAAVYSTPAASTSTVNLKAKLCTVSGCGSGTVVTLASITSAALGTVQATNNPLNMTLNSSTVATGATATFEAHGNLVIDIAALASAAEGIYADNNTATVGTIDSTAQLFLQITCAFSNASGSNSMTERQLIADVVD